MSDQKSNQDHPSEYVRELTEGFNAGYQIRTHYPELAEKLDKALEGTDTPFFSAMIEGSKTRDMELTKDRERAKGKDVGHEKDHLRPDPKTPVPPLSKEDIARYQCRAQDLANRNRFRQSEKEKDKTPDKEKGMDRDER